MEYIPIGHPKAKHYYYDTQNISGDPDPVKGFWFDRNDINYGLSKNSIDLDPGDEIRITIKDMIRYQATIYVIDYITPRQYVIANSNGPYIHTNRFSDVTVNGVLNGNSSDLDENGRQQISFTSLVPQTITPTLFGRYSLDSTQQYEFKLEKYEIHKTNGMIIDLMNPNITKWVDVHQVGGKQKISYDLIDWSKHSLNFSSSIVQLPELPEDDHTLLQVGGSINIETVMLPKSFNGKKLIVDFNKFLMTSNIKTHDFQIGSNDIDESYYPFEMINSVTAFNVRKTSGFTALLNVQSSLNDVDFNNNILYGDNGTLIRWSLSDTTLLLYNNFSINCGRGLHIYNGSPYAIIENNTCIGCTEYGLRLLATGTKILLNNYSDAPTSQCFIGTYTDEGGNISSDATARDPENRGVSLVSAFEDPYNGNYTPRPDGSLKVGVEPIIVGHDKYLNDADIKEPFYSGAFGIVKRNANLIRRRIKINHFGLIGSTNFTR